MSREPMSLDDLRYAAEWLSGIADEGDENQAASFLRGFCEGIRLAQMRYRYGKIEQEVDEIEAAPGVDART